MIDAWGILRGEAQQSQLGLDVFTHRSHISRATMAYDLGPLGQQSTASAALLLIGAIAVATTLYSAIRVLLSVLVLPGTSVCASLLI
jgi:hypothetical protein